MIDTWNAAVSNKFQCYKKQYSVGIYLQWFSCHRFTWLILWIRLGIGIFIEIFIIAQPQRFFRTPHCRLFQCVSKWRSKWQSHGGTGSLNSGSLLWHRNWNGCLQSSVAQHVLKYTDSNVKFRKFSGVIPQNFIRLQLSSQISHATFTPKPLFSPLRKINRINKDWLNTVFAQSVIDSFTTQWELLKIKWTWQRHVCTYCTVYPQTCDITFLYNAFAAFLYDNLISISGNLFILFNVTYTQIAMTIVPRLQSSSYRHRQKRQLKILILSNIKPTNTTVVQTLTNRHFSKKVLKADNVLW